MEQRIRAAAQNGARKRPRACIECAGSPFVNECSLWAKNVGADLGLFEQV